MLLHKNCIWWTTKSEGGFFLSLSHSKLVFFLKRIVLWDYRLFAGLITAVITGRGNREVHAVQPRWGQTPRHGVFFHEVGRAFLRFFFLFSFFPVAAEKSKSEIRIAVSRVAEKSNGERKPREQSRNGNGLSPEISLQLKNRRSPFDVSLRLSGDSALSCDTGISLLDYCRSACIIYVDLRKSSVLNGNCINGSWKMYSRLDFKVN